MARKMTVQVLCDVCQSPVGVETLRFGWNLVNYEVDLCPDHSEQMSRVVEPVVEVSRRLGARPSSGPSSAPSFVAPREQVTTTEVRAWAKRKGIEVSNRGRIPDELFDRYLAETRSS